MRQEQARLSAGNVAQTEAMPPERNTKKDGVSEMTNQAIAIKNSNKTTQTDNTLKQSNNVGRGGRVSESGDLTLSRLDVDVERIAAQSSRMSKKERQRREIEAQGKVVKDFMLGNTRVKINDAYCRDKTPAEVDAILANISIRAQAQLTAQEATKSK